MRMLAIAAAVLAAAASARADVIGDIVSVGYRTTSGFAIRPGYWTPVVVDLTLQGADSFDGVLRLRQFDRDGDAFYDTVPVHLSTAATAQNRYTLYTVVNPGESSESRLAVELLETADGPERLVEMISGGAPRSALVLPTPPHQIDGRAHLLLSVGADAAGKVRLLDSYDLEERLLHHVRVAHTSPEGLPSQWFGLEMVDFVVWDGADATQLSPGQTTALLDWVRQGGVLMIAAAKTADTLKQSAHFGPLLPVDIDRVENVQSLPETRRLLLNIREDESSAAQASLPIVKAKLRSGEDVEQIMFEEELDSVVAASRRHGDGQIIFVGAELRWLLREADQTGVLQFFQRTMELRDSELNKDVQLSAMPLYQYLDRQTSFYGRSGAYMALAIIFSIVYVLVATLGLWKLLSRRDLLKHSWTALAAFSLVASVLSILGVQSVRGIARHVRQVTVVDGTLGSVDAQATAYFGLTTPIHSTLDVWLPQEPGVAETPSATACTLKPMPEIQLEMTAETRYADPASYRIQPTTASIEGVPVRATLKQFEGRWQGHLKGSLLGKLNIGYEEAPKREADQPPVSYAAPTRGSWIENNLGVHFSRAFLLVAHRDAFSRPTFIQFSPRADVQNGIDVLPLGEIPEGGRIDLHAAATRRPRGEPVTEADVRSRDLKANQRRWSQDFTATLSQSLTGQQQSMPEYRLDHVQNAVLLLTTLGDHDVSMYNRSHWSQGVFSAELCSQLDWSLQLDQEHAIFVGFAENEPGPCELHVRGAGGGEYDGVKPEESMTVYRFIVPITSREGRGS